MEINANVSNAVATSISKLNISTARHNFEFKQTPKKADIEEKETVIPDTTSKKSDIDVEDIQKYAKYMGENLSIDDINYALMYGRSVIADFSV